MGTLQQQSFLKGHQAKGDVPGSQVHRLFVRAAKNHPDRLAIVFEDADGRECSLSYKELDRLTDRLARALSKHDRGDSGKSQAFVAVCMKASDRLPIVLLSILKAGMAYLPLDAEFPMSRVQHVLQEAEPLLVIIEKEADSLIYEGTLTRTYERLLEEALRERDDPLDIDDDDDDDPNRLAIVLYTSGSTGIPKGVLLPHATLLNRLQWQWRELPFADNEERCIFKTALTFVDSVPEIWGPLLQGRTLIVVPREITRNPERFVQMLDRHKIQRLVLVPSLLRSMLMYLAIRSKDSVLSSLRLWICSGESLPVSLADRFFAIFDDGQRILANFYGSTEIMGDVTFHVINDRDQLKSLEKVPIGRPIDNSIVYLVNKDMRLVSQGEIGELVVAGKNLAAGYLGDNESKRFLDNPHAIDPEYSRIFRTGDYARMMKETIMYEGRVDSQIKVRGHRVDLTEVERAVSRVPEVDKAVVLCYKPGELSQALVAFVAVKEKSSTSSLQIENFVQSILPPYMQPQIVIIDQIPLLINGKTDRQALLKRYEKSNLADGDNEETSYDYTGVSEEDLEKAKILFSTVASVIGASSRAPITLEANFYELGGNSLNSIYTVTKLKDQGYHISITDFITAKTLGDALMLIRYNPDEDSSLKESIDPEDRYYEMLNDSHKEDCIQIITESFSNKADLEQWLTPEVDKEDYRTLMELLWKSLIEKDLSFVVRSSEDKKILGVSLNFDLWDEPEVVFDSKLMIVFCFLEHLEAPIRERKLPKGKGQIIHNFMMATHETLNAAENIIIMRQMEEYCLHFAKAREYAGVFTTNTSPLTQQLGSDVYGYETLLAYRVNKYVMPDGTKPFGKAPDSQLAICSLKMIN